jgi:amidohydrolase family protein
MRRIVPLLSLLPLATLAFAEPAAERALVVRNATVETLTAAGRLERATVVIRDGKIAALGKDIAVPESATVIDAAGGTLMPGIIDPYFTVTIAAGTTEAAPRTVVIGGRTINVPGGFGNRGAGTFTRVADNFYPFDTGFKPLPRVGLTKLNLVTSGLGQAAVVRVTPGQPERMLDRADGVAYATVTNSTESLDQIRTRLTRGGGGGGRPGGFGGGGFGGGAPAAGTQLWTDVLEGKAPLIVEAANAAAVVHLLKALEPHKNVKLVLFLAGDAVAETVPLLKERKATVILRPRLDLLPNTRDRFNAARMLQEAGVDFVFSLTARPPAAAGGFGAAAALQTEEQTPPLTIDSDFPLFPVALLTKTGLPRSTALEALTKKPAGLLGLDKTHGTIEAGKVADLLLFTGDPLDPASRLRHTIIDGRIVYAY